MNEEEYRELLQRVEENQRSLRSHTDEEGEFALTAKQLIDLLERAKQRMVHRHDGK
jgi:hypothetical protein